MKPKTLTKTSVFPFWLCNYNLLSGFLWGLLLIQTSYLQFKPLGGQPRLFQATYSNLLVIETLALVELYNAAAGIVKSSVFTTFIQLYARFSIIWGLLYPFSDSDFNNSTSCYYYMVVAWSVTEVIRYNYYAANMIFQGEPGKVLTWLRYNTFLVMYPLGLFCEVSILLGNFPDFVAALGGSRAAELFFYTLLLLYIPGFSLLYGHMLKQRKKIMRKF
ncbi:hypothetical protein BABINDRAFT_36251 [Babjeviella inositovora NRRL Y-12698]|uniref:Very-long-chain (3R)-3-hydroxyacyl-CoA dehydratase n=1 Tax=Babjeviella inositovora NRRL Y-12698 TaxID=984486 RepID=A0A1E3QQT8_9ASCO|nr:uncharacterized protein BABINDRAFT_36251 [Babjeviella inositovora NRRL Y-12698]ODQ80020.1 hypothetical protein BABINDRAFT_36251 [Babjeviella inositovora NRRL Y-12698]